MALINRESACKYEINDRRLGSAIRFLNLYAEGPIGSASYRKHTSIVYPHDDSGCFFKNDASWKDLVSQFLNEYCLPNSYATFRDNEGTWFMAHVDDEGEVIWDVMGVENPFKDKCERMEL